MTLRAPYVAPDSHPHRVIIDQAFATAEVSWSVAVEATGWDLVLRFARYGLGLAIVNDICEIPRDLAAIPTSALTDVPVQTVNQLVDLIAQVRIAKAVVPIARGEEGHLELPAHQPRQTASLQPNSALAHEICKGLLAIEALKRKKQVCRTNVIFGPGQQGGQFMYGYVAHDPINSADPSGLTSTVLYGRCPNSVFSSSKDAADFLEKALQHHLRNFLANHPKWMYRLLRLRSPFLGRHQAQCTMSLQQWHPDPAIKWISGNRFTAFVEPSRMAGDVAIADTLWVTVWDRQTNAYAFYIYDCRTGGFY